MSFHRVGTLSGSLAHAILRETPGIQIVLYGGQEEPYRDLELGRTDAVLLDSVIAARYGLTKPDLELADPDVARGTYVIAVRRGEDELRDALDGALADLLARGELEPIFAKLSSYLPELPDRGPGADLIGRTAGLGSCRILSLAGDDVESRGGRVRAHLHQPRSSGPSLR